MTEEWRPIDGWPYEVSDLGLVRRTVPACGTQRGAVLRHNNSGRYSMVMLQRNHVRTTVQVHLLVARAFLGPCPQGYEVNHKDGDKHNPVLSNLEYLTPQQNVKHAVSNRLHMHGARHYAAKVGEQEVREIRQLARTMHYAAIGRQYGLSKSAVGHIVRWKNWRHLSTEEPC